MRESTVESYFKARVKALGGEWRKCKWIGRRNCPDDFVAFPNGWHGFVEMKRPGKEPNKGQWREINRLNALKVNAVYLPSKEAVDCFLEMVAGPKKVLKIEKSL